MSVIFNLKNKPINWLLHQHNKPLPQPNEFQPLVQVFTSYLNKEDDPHCLFYANSPFVTRLARRFKTHPDAALVKLFEPDSWEGMLYLGQGPVRGIFDSRSHNAMCKLNFLYHNPALDISNYEAILQKAVANRRAPDTVNALRRLYQEGPQFLDDDPWFRDMQVKEITSIRRNHGEEFFEREYGAQFEALKQSLLNKLNRIRYVERQLVSHEAVGIITDYDRLLLSQKENLQANLQRIMNVFKVNWTAFVAGVVALWFYHVFGHSDASHSQHLCMAGMMFLSFGAEDQGIQDEELFQWMLKASAVRREEFGSRLDRETLLVMAQTILRAASDNKILKERLYFWSTRHMKDKEAGKIIEASNAVEVGKQLLAVQLYEALRPKYPTGGMGRRGFLNLISKAVGAAHMGINGEITQAAVKIVSGWDGPMRLTSPLALRLYEAHSTLRFTDFEVLHFIPWVEGVENPIAVYELMYRCYGKDYPVGHIPALFIRMAKSAHPDFLARNNIFISDSTLVRESLFNLLGRLCGPAIDPVTFKVIILESKAKEILLLMRNSPEVFHAMFLEQLNIDVTRWIEDSFYLSLNGRQSQIAKKLKAEGKSFKEIKAAVEADDEWSQYHWAQQAVMKNTVSFAQESLQIRADMLYRKLVALGQIVDEAQVPNCYGICVRKRDGPDIANILEVDLQNKLPPQHISRNTGEYRFFPLLDISAKHNINTEGFHAKQIFSGHWHVEPEPFEGSRPLPDIIAAGEIGKDDWVGASEERLIQRAVEDTLADVLENEHLLTETIQWYLTKWKTVKSKLIKTMDERIMLEVSARAYAFASRRGFLSKAAKLAAGVAVLPSASILVDLDLPMSILTKDGDRALRGIQNALAHPHWRGNNLDSRHIIVNEAMARAFGESRMRYLNLVPPAYSDIVKNEFPREIHAMDGQYGCFVSEAFYALHDATTSLLPVDTKVDYRSFPESKMRLLVRQLKEAQTRTDAPILTTFRSFAKQQHRMLTGTLRMSQASQEADAEKPQTQKQSPSAPQEQHTSSARSNVDRPLEGKVDVMETMEFDLMRWYTDGGKV